LKRKYFHNILKSRLMQSFIALILLFNIVGTNFQIFFHHHNNTGCAIELNITDGKNTSSNTNNFVISGLQDKSIHDGHCFICYFIQYYQFNYIIESLPKTHLPNESVYFILNDIPVFSQNSISQSSRAPPVIS
jgi:hypothetical protein